MLSQTANAKHYHTQVVFICRFNSIESIHIGPVKCGLYK